jgi:hypothetical protein
VAQACSNVPSRRLEERDPLVPATLHGRGDGQPRDDLALQAFALGKKQAPSTVMGALVAQVGRRDPRFLVTDADGNVLCLTGNRCCVVDAEIRADLDRFAADRLAASARGEQFLFRSGASLLTALTRLPPQPVPANQMGRYVRAGRGP